MNFTCVTVKPVIQMSVIYIYMIKEHQVLRYLSSLLINKQHFIRIVTCFLNNIRNYFLELFNQKVVNKTKQLSNYFIKNIFQHFQLIVVNIQG